jgi:hypothetical protein
VTLGSRCFSLRGALENVVTRVIRKRSGFKMRLDGSERVFGGVNVVMCGDWWQLRPVGGTALFSVPEECCSDTGRRALSLFRGAGVNALRGLWELSFPMRCPDPWYNRMMGLFRSGCLPLDAYNFFHGYPTSTPASWQLSQEVALHSCSCAQDVERLSGAGSVFVKRSWATLFLLGHSGRDIINGVSQDLHGPMLEYAVEQECVSMGTPSTTLCLQHAVAFACARHLARLCLLLCSNAL